MTVRQRGEMKTYPEGCPTIEAEAKIQKFENRF
jgi:hypothetical protein